MHVFKYGMTNEELQALLAPFAELRPGFTDQRTEGGTINETWPLVIKQQHQQACECGRTCDRAGERTVHRTTDGWREYCHGCAHWRDPDTGKFTIPKASAWREWRRIESKRKPGQPAKNKHQPAPQSATTGIESTADPDIVAVVQEYPESRITRYVDLRVESLPGPGDAPGPDT